MQYKDIDADFERRFSTYTQTSYLAITPRRVVDLATRSATAGNTL